jgi:hypothetical protein
MSTSAKTASFWSPEKGSRDQQNRRVRPAPLHGADRALTVRKCWLRVSSALIGSAALFDGVQEDRLGNDPIVLGRWPQSHGGAGSVSKGLAAQRRRTGSILLPVKAGLSHRSS